MSQSLPKQVKFLVIGAGVHGLSTAYHLARELKARGRGSAADVLVVDKTAVGAGASGIACGVVRNYYVQPAMGGLDGPQRRRLGIRPGGVSLPPGRLPRRRRRRPAGGFRAHRRAPRAHRLPGAARARRAGGLRLHARPLPGLARARAERLPARVPGRVRLQPRVDARAGQKGDRTKASASFRGCGSRGSIWPPTAACARSAPRPGSSRSSTWSWASAPGSRASGACSASR